MDAAERLLQERFAGIGGPDDGNWNDVRLRARRRGRRTGAFVAAAVVALVVTGLGLGGQVVGLFSADGKRIPFSTLSATDRRFTLLGLCSRVTIVSPAGHAPFLRCLDGAPRIEEVANDGVTFTWKLSYRNGTTCTASGRLPGFRDPRGDLSKIQTMHCDTLRRGTALVPAHAASLLPTPERPITTDIGITMNPRNGRARILRASGLAGAGIETVGLVAKDGSVLRAQVRGRSYDFRGPIPDRLWIAIAAFDRSGKEVYRKPIPVLAVRPRPSTRVAKPRRRPAPRVPVGRPLQQATNDIGVIAVYRKGLVLRFSRTARAERVMRRVAGDGRIPLSCAHLAYGAGTWLDVGAGGSAQLRGRTAILGYAFWANGRPPTPPPPFDYCQVTGLYGRRWNDQYGPHELLEVPFTPIGRRYFSERAAARDLALFIRTRAMQAIRKAVHRGERAPSAALIARRFGPRIVPLASRSRTAPVGTIGIWTDGGVIVASELASDGRRLFVIVRGIQLRANNIGRPLAFPF